MVDQASEWREKLIETAVEQDDDAMESYLNGEEPSLEVLKNVSEKELVNSPFSQPIADLLSKTKVFNSSWMQL